MNKQDLCRFNLAAFPACCWLKIFRGGYFFPNARNFLPSASAILAESMHISTRYRWAWFAPHRMRSSDRGRLLRDRALGKPSVVNGPVAAAGSMSSLGGGQSSPAGCPFRPCRRRAEPFERKERAGPQVPQHLRSGPLDSARQFVLVLFLCRAAHRSLSSTSSTRSKRAACCGCFAWRAAIPTGPIPIPWRAAVAAFRRWSKRRASAAAGDAGAAMRWFFRPA